MLIVESAWVLTVKETVSKNFMHSLQYIVLRIVTIEDCSEFDEIPRDFLTYLQQDYHVSSINIKLFII